MFKEKSDFMVILGDPVLISNIQLYFYYAFRTVTGVLFFGGNNKKYRIELNLHKNRG